MRHLILLITALLIASAAHAQSKINLEAADNLIGGREDGISFQKLIGNVVLSQGETRIYCDTATLFRQNNNFDARGKVRIVDGDSITITSSRLLYDGNTRIARLRGNVVFVKKGIMTLYTDFLDYDRNISVARYFNGGQLVDSTNVLKSVKGYYNDITELASFKKEVEGYNDDYTLFSDTLQYHTVERVIYFRDSTLLIRQEDSTVWTYNEGEYDTRSDKSLLYQNRIETDEYILEAREFLTDESTGLYKARTDVLLIQKKNDIIITGEKGDYDKENEITRVYENALMKMKVNEDTLYLRADTLVSIDSEIPEERRLLAFPSVRIFKSNLQGSADSLAYHISDSVIYFYQDPVLWTGENQMKADSINIEIVDQNIDKMNMALNSFVVSQDTLKNYNQVKGKYMTAYFKENDVEKVYVTGNAESIYYALTNDMQFVQGMNKAACSHMTLNFIENEIDNIVFYVNPDASFIPPHELGGAETKLKGFVWTPERRPSLEQVLTGKFTTEEQDPGEEKNEQQLPENPAIPKSMTENGKKTLPTQLRKN